MENAKREPKYKVGDRVKFEFDGGTWVGTIEDMKEFHRVGTTRFTIFGIMNGIL